MRRAKRSTIPFRSNGCHQQFPFKCPNIFHLKNIYKPIYYGKELQSPVELICFVGSVPKPVQGQQQGKEAVLSVESCAMGPVIVMNGYEGT